MLLNWLAIVLACAAYLAGLRKWVYEGKLFMGLAAVFICFPVIILLTMDPPAIALRAIPLVGVAMFFHHYGRRILMQIKLLWFTTLSVLVVQFYYVCYAHFAMR